MFHAFLVDQIAEADRLKFMFYAEIVDQRAEADGMEFMLFYSEIVQ